MESYSSLIAEALNAYSPKDQYERILALLQSERDLAIAKGALSMVDLFRNDIKDCHPVIARYVPINPFSQEPANPEKAVFESDL